MRVTLIYRGKFVYADGAIREMTRWRLPGKTAERPHGLRYRLFYGNTDGTCLVLYDNETGKGDYRHIMDTQEPYEFKDVETLVADFLEDIEGVRRREE